MAIASVHKIWIAGKCLLEKPFSEYMEHLSKEYVSDIVVVSKQVKYGWSFVIIPFCFYLKYQFKQASVLRRGVSFYFCYFCFVRARIHHTWTRIFT